MQQGMCQGQADVYVPHGTTREKGQGGEVSLCNGIMQAILSRRIDYMSVSSTKGGTGTVLFYIANGTTERRSMQYSVYEWCDVSPTYPQGA
jgi:hypothetical protein